MKTTHYLAVDLGAESGRVMLGTLKEGHLSLDEIHRFPNNVVAKDLLVPYHRRASMPKLADELKAALPA